MTKPESDLPQSLRYPLRTEEIRAEGRRAAFQLALENGGDLSRVASEIEWSKDHLSDPFATSPGQPWAPGTSVRRHTEGYLVGLKDALAIMSQAAAAVEDNSDTRQMALREEMILAEGRRNAFQFVLECGGDQLRIRSEIEYYESELSNASATSPGQPLAPDTSVRHHIEGYLAGLKDALTILLQAEAAQPAPLKSIAEAPVTPYQAKIPRSRKSNGAQQKRKRKTRSITSKKRGTS